MRPSRSAAATHGAVLRATLGYAVVAACVALVVTTWLARGFTVDSGSMAGTLLGPHAWVRCGDCGWPFAAGIEGPQSAGRPAICPNCGYAEQSLPEEAIAGDGVLVARSAYRFRKPRRWEVVAFRAPGDASEVYVKRVVGLPGERIAIVDGDVYADGEIVRKSLAEQRAVAIPVHDNNYRPPTANDLPERWQADPASHWQKSGTGFTFPAGATSADPTRAASAGESPIHHSSFIIHYSSLDWLTYRHWQRAPDGAAAESPVLDAYGYNQTYPVAELHAVRDLLLSFRLTAEGEGKLYLRASDGGNEFVCVIGADGRIELWQQGRIVQQTSASRARSGQCRVEFSTVDQAILLAIDGQTLLDFPFAAVSPPPPGTSRPFAIASDGLTMRIDDLRIDRDVYYGSSATASVASDRERPLELADDEFFVLADNSTLGMDSRTAAFGPAVAAKLFVGKPLLGYGKRRAATPWGAAIQVPALRQIRYIR